MELHRPRPLFVVADDGGIDTARDEGILACVDAGIVRNVAVLATGATAAPLLAALAERPGVAVLLHLDLTHDGPLGPPAPSLTGTDGRFLPSKQALWRRAVDGGVRPEEVATEARAQRAVLEAAGVRVAGLNGHNHVHLLPGVREGVALLLSGDGLPPWVRLPRCAVPPEGTPPVIEPALPWVAAEADDAERRLAATGHTALAGLAHHARHAAPLWAGRARWADHFLGCAWSDEPTVDVLARALAALPAVGTVEWMVHPGRTAAGSVPYSADPARGFERDALCSPALAAAVAAAGFRPAAVTDPQAGSASPSSNV